MACPDRFGFVTLADPQPSLDADMMLCDFAESINGKLYIMGGGWAQVHGADPISCAVAIRLGVPWDQTNVVHRMRVELVDQDGGPVLGPDGLPVRVEGDLEVGRPVGTTPGSDLSHALAIRFQGLPLPDNQYRFALTVDGQPLASASFRVVRPPGWTFPSAG